MKERFKLAIYRVPVGTFGWKPRQRVIYTIARMQAGMPNELPEVTFRTQGLRIEWDRLHKRVRGVGNDFGTIMGKHLNGDITPWIPVGKVDSPTRVALPQYDSFAHIFDAIADRMDGVNPNAGEIINISEIPVMILDDGRLLCFPKTAVLPRILIVGKSGKGKSWTLNSLAGRIFYLWEDHIGLLNDSLDQFYDMMLPMEQGIHVKHLQLYGNEPRYLPGILLYMSCPRLNMRYVDEKIAYRLVVSFPSVLKRLDHYAHSMKKINPEKAGKYLYEMSNQLADCRTVDEFMEKLDALTPNKDEKGWQNMNRKIRSIMDIVFDAQFTDNLYPSEENTASFWKLKLASGEEIVEHPFIACLEAGLFPILNNAQAKTHFAAKIHMADLMRKIVDYQINRGKDKQKRTWILVDELKDMIEKKSSILYDSTDYVFTQGRFNRVGYIGNIQEYTKLTPAMRANSTHLFIFELQTEEERSAIRRDYELDRDRVKEISDLQTFQCLLTTKESVVIYDRDGIRSEVRGGIYRGKVIPPITVHRSPEM